VLRDLRLSVCRRLSVTLCIVAKQCVLEQKLLLTMTAYRKSFMRNRLVVDTKMNDLDLRLDVVSRSCKPLRHIFWISRKPLQTKAWFQGTTNREWPMGIKWSRDRWRHLKGQTCELSPNTLRAQYLDNGWSELPFQRTTKMAHGVSNGHTTDDVTWPPKVSLWCSTVRYPSDSLASSVSCLTVLVGLAL